jgi:hypothetical protein
MEWIDQLRIMTLKNNRSLTTSWFWKNFNFDNQSLWIGKLNEANLPDDSQAICEFMQLIASDFQLKVEKKDAFLKLYYATNSRTNLPEINYLVVCAHKNLPANFDKTFISIMFEKYQLTSRIINMDKDFRKLLEHYLIWSNFYTYQNLVKELCI